VTVWGLIFLGLIAAATLTTAVVQVAVLVAAARMARRVELLVERIERDVQPTLQHVYTIGRDTQRAVALATAQIERVDQLFTDLTHVVKGTVATLQASVAAPAREGKALLSALRAAGGKRVPGNAPRTKTHSSSRLPP
jgi:hypothetical protein